MKFLYKKVALEINEHKITSLNRHVGTDCCVKMEDSLCRIGYNRERYHLRDYPYIFGLQSYKRLNWAGNVQGMDVSNIPSRCFVKICTAKEQL
jgi:hypothetical protein